MPTDIEFEIKALRRFANRVERVAEELDDEWHTYTGTISKHLMIAVALLRVAALKIEYPADDTYAKKIMDELPF